MQNKSAIWVFTILLILACLYQLSFSVVTSQVEGKAKSVAQEKLDSLVSSSTAQLNEVEKDSALQRFESEYLFSQNGEKVYPVIGFTYKYCKKQEVNRGLDLQGGMNVVLEVSVVDLIKALSANSNNPTFIEAIRRANEAQKTSQDDYVTLFGDAITDLDPNFKLASVFHNRENQEKFARDASNEDILAIISTEATDAIKRTEQVIRKRIDNLGVVQPKVQRLSTSGRIIVELPGVKDKIRVRKILQGTAKLEFWETHDNKDLIGGLQQANDYLRDLKKLESKTTDVATDSTSDVIADVTTDAAAVSATDSLMSSLAGNETDSTKSDSSLVSDEASREKFNEENPLYSILSLNISQDPQSGGYFPNEGPTVGFANIQDTASINKFLSRKDIVRFFPPKTKFLWDAKAYDKNEQFYQLYAINVTSREGKAALEGDAVSNARPDTDPLGNAEVSLTMTPTGAQKWKLLTKENVGKSIAIVLDNMVYTAPRVSGEIAGGQSSISGRFTIEEAEDLSNILKAGKLPAPATIIEEAVVGPSLGAEAIHDGLMSFVIALIIVLIYMAMYYSTAGMVADIALAVNLFFIIGVLASLNATLTLPGIAGIVLTIGMAVDANVLIFERIREEMASGKGLKMAIADGFSNAYSSIIDSNVTTLLTGIVLNVFGTGPIQGFATTLIIGILTSLFCAIFITRLIFEWQLENSKNIAFDNKFTAGAFKNLNFNFIGNKKKFYIVSGIIIAIGFGSFATRGFNYGVDFTGGRSYLVRFDNIVEVGAVSDALGNVFVENGLKQIPEVKVYGTSNQVKITTKYLISESNEDTDAKVESKLAEGLSVFNYKYEIMSSQKVEPTIADDIKQSAVFSVLFSLIIIFLYILLRFKGWQFGTAALIAMFHDVLIVLAFYSMFYGILPFSMEIDQAFIAAILTVVGYSINDTVIIFDRIREFLHIHKRLDMPHVINDALNSTLSRTINTSLTTIFVLLMIFIFGGEVIRGFVFALLVGIVVGTYSSLCIAAPVMLDFTAKDKESK